MKNKIIGAIVTGMVFIWGISWAQNFNSPNQTAIFHAKSFIGVPGGVIQYVDPNGNVTTLYTVQPYEGSTSTTTINVSVTAISQ